MIITGKHLIVSIVFITFVLALSCKPSTTTNTKLQGNWQIHKAYRNGRKTVTLENVYFNFWGNDSVRTNFTGEEISHSYIFRHDSIVINGNYPGFKIFHNKNDTLIITTTIKGNNFTLMLANNEKNEN